MQVRAEQQVGLGARAVVLAFLRFVDAGMKSELIVIVRVFAQVGHGALQLDAGNGLILEFHRDQVHGVSSFFLDIMVIHALALVVLRVRHVLAGVNLISENDILVLSTIIQVNVLHTHFELAASHSQKNRIRKAWSILFPLCSSSGGRRGGGGKKRGENFFPFFSLFRV